MLNFYQKNKGQSSKIKNRGLAWSKRPEMRIYSPLIGLITTTFWNTKINKSIQSYTWGSREEFHTRMRGWKDYLYHPRLKFPADILILTSHLYPYPAIIHDIPMFGWLYHHAYSIRLPKDINILQIPRKKLAWYPDYTIYILVRYIILKITYTHLFILVVPWKVLPHVVEYSNLYLAKLGTLINRYHSTCSKPT